MNALARLVQRIRAIPSAMMPRAFVVPHEFRTGAWQRNLVCTTEELTAFSAVYACVSIISQDIAKLGLNIWREDPARGRMPATGHPAARLLRSPNEWQTIVEFVQQWLLSILLTGNAYIFMQRDARGVPATLTVLDPRNVRVYLLDDGSPAYRVGEDPLAGIGFEDVIPARDIIHDRINPLWHPLVGVSPLVAAAASTHAGIRILEQSAEFFGAMSRPSGMLTTDQPLRDDVRDRMRKAWQERQGGAENAGNTALLGFGLKWHPLTLTAVDAQLIEQLRFSVEDVARAYRVPSFMLGDLNKVSYRNAEQLSRVYYNGCLAYHIERLEWRLDQSLDLASDIEIEFDLDALFRLEADVRFASYQSALNAGWLSVNEVRAREGLPPVKGGEEPRLQQQYRPISEPPPDPKPPPPDPPDPDDAEPEDEDEDEDEDMARMLRGLVHAPA